MVSACDCLAVLVFWTGKEEPNFRDHRAAPPVKAVAEQRLYFIKLIPPLLDVILDSRADRTPDTLPWPSGYYLPNVAMFSLFQSSVSHAQKEQVLYLRAHRELT